jgi:hypothetical protein
LAREYIDQRNGSAALRALDELPNLEPHAIGPELNAQLHAARGSAFALGKNVALSQQEAAAARSYLDAVTASLPERYRSTFTARSDIQALMRRDAFGAPR